MEKKKNKVSNSSYNVNVTYGFRLLNGTNNIPTASYVVVELRQIGDGDHDVGLFGIFDGITNYQTPAYLQSYPFKNIIAEPEFWLSTAYAVRRGYLITNNNLVERIDLRSISASSAVTAILMNHHDEWMLVVANVGNSRAIICCKNGVAKQLSVNHDLLNKMERGARKQRVSYLLITRHFELFVDTDKIKENL
ncbi:probable protein phosphatase 2C 62 [Prunus avium]|uniref:Probable protein phosphatase 2C 62 n=1 Tax=Prunus avium TaxID=42229 RepID=A0A6P5TPF5_PRUAV|nr:probable protein phosphatase 2C 62 [Prunus avium]